MVYICIFIREKRFIEQYIELVRIYGNPAKYQSTNKDMFTNILNKSDNP